MINSFVAFRKCNRAQYVESVLDSFEWILALQWYIGGIAGVVKLELLIKSNITKTHRSSFMSVWYPIISNTGIALFWFIVLAGCLMFAHVLFVEYPQLKIFYQ